MERLLVPFAIALGGAGGALLRYGATLAAKATLGDRFAWGILAVNVLGCFLIGLLMHAAIREGQMQLPSHVHAGITVGLLGALTTFSTFGYDTVVLWYRDPRLAIVNVVANLALGLLAVVLGQYLGDSIQQAA